MRVPHWRILLPGYRTATAYIPSTFHTQTAAPLLLASPAHLRLHRCCVAACARTARGSSPAISRTITVHFACLPVTRTLTYLHHCAARTYTPGCRVLGCAPVLPALTGLPLPYFCRFGLRRDAGASLRNAPAHACAPHRVPPLTAICHRRVGPFSTLRNHTTAHCHCARDARTSASTLPLYTHYLFHLYAHLHTFTTARTAVTRAP